MFNIKQNIAPPEKWKYKCPYTMKPQCIIVHNTANDASAANEINYMLNNNEYKSFHYAIDDIEIVQGVSEDRNAYHAGDGDNGKGNRTGIAIEICYSKSGGEKFLKAEQLAAKFIALKLKEYGWGIDKVTKHQDYSGKYCPHRTLDMGWQRFLDMIKEEIKRNDERVLELPEDWYWTMLLDNIKLYKSKGFITGDEWEKKVKSKTITTDELAWLNNEIISRIVENQA